MKNKIILLFVLVFLFQVNNIYSQGCDVDDPNDSIPAAKIKIFGFLQPEYNYTLSDPAESTFAFRRARIGVRGRLFEDFTYYFMLETSPFIGGVGSAYLMDAFVSWDKYNWTRIAVGSFKQPFGLEVATACNALLTIDRAIVSDQLVVPQRDYGLMLLGGNKYTKFGYAVALMNGSGLNTKDENNKKDIIGRATYKLFDFMTIGASFRYGYPVPNDNDDSRTTYGGEILLEFNNLHIQGEYIYDEGAYNRAADAGCGAEPLELAEKRDGAYGMIWYDTKWNLQPVFKYEFFDQDLDRKDIPNAYSERMTLGVNYFFNDSIRLQVNYQANIETVLNIDNDKFLAQIQVVF
jgi:phosphate-selective porin